MTTTTSIRCEHRHKSFPDHRERECRYTAMYVISSKQHDLLLVLCEDDLASHMADGSTYQVRVIIDDTFLARLLQARENFCRRQDYRIAAECRAKAMEILGTL